MMGSKAIAAGCFTIVALAAASGFVGLLAGVLICAILKNLGDSQVLGFSALIALPAGTAIGAIGGTAIGVKFILLIREQSKGGKCLKCGYDMRGSPERCPECGLSPTAHYESLYRRRESNQ